MIICHEVTKLMDLQSWTNVLGTVLQYSYFSVISHFPLKTAHHFRNFLAVLPPPLYTKLKLGKNSGYTRPTDCLWGEGGWTCVNWKTPQKRKSVPRLLYMIVGQRRKIGRTLWKYFRAQVEDSLFMLYRLLVGFSYVFLDIYVKDQFVSG